MRGMSLQLCFSRLKRPSSNTPRQMHNTVDVPTTSASSTSSPSSSVIFKNFNSLFDPQSSYGSDTTYYPSTSTSDPDARLLASDSDLASAIASRRFFPSAPGASNSIVDAAAVSIGAAEGVAVPTYSPDPYEDFRRSMEEMVAALGLGLGGRAELQELLLCYLALNRRHAHKYIVGAFADLLVGLSASSAEEERPRG